MKLTQMIERIQQEFPQKTGTEIILEINKSYRDFASKSESCITYTDVSGVSVATNTIDLKTDLDFEIDGSKVKEVRYLDANGNDVEQVEALSFEITPDKKMVFYNYYGQPVTSIAVDHIRIYYSYIPNEMNTGSDEPDMPTELQDGILYDVLEKFHQTIPTLVKRFPDGSTSVTKDWDSIRYYNTKYKEKIIDAKKWANSWTPIKMTSQADNY